LASGAQRPAHDVQLPLHTSSVAPTAASNFSQLITLASLAIAPPTPRWHVFECHVDPQIFEGHTMLAVPNSTRILVIGGGPGGSTAATLLARQGYEVLLFERDYFPRYHIGESLLPSILQILDLLGARQKVEQFGFQLKHGAFFEWGPERWGLNFGELNGKCTYSYQVERADLDHLLLKHAESQGVQVFEGMQVDALQFDGDRPVSAAWSKRERATNGHAHGNEVVAEGKLSFDYLIDASGRQGIMATRYLRNRRFHKVFQNVAIWGYWNNAARIGREGDICCGSVAHGWLWAIPLRHAISSVGVVMHKQTFTRQRASSSLQQIYLNSIKESSLIQSIVEPAVLTSTLHTDQDYSYASAQFAGPGYFIVGDAACFLDPLLSSGVHLATYSALLAAASIGSTLRGEVTAEEAAAFYESSYRQAYLRFLVFLSAFYDVGRSKESYFWEAQQLTKEDVQSGDLKLAFLNLVTGIKDMTDAQGNAHRLVLSAMARRINENLRFRKDKTSLAALVGARQEQVDANARFFTSVEGLFAMNEEEAIEGLFVAAEPQLRLVRASKPPRAAPGAHVRRRR
jgi:flavin-dependent dehydrogenase